MKNYILITGASSGIGKAYAIAYAKRGENVILVSRSEDKLNALAKNLIETYSVEAEVIAMDLSVEHIAKDLYKRVTEKEITVTTVINNAGFATKGLFSNSGYDMQHREMLLNIITLTEITYLFIADMAKVKSGTIINVASSGSFNAMPYSAVYSASKSYVLSFTESINFEYKAYGVHALAVCPGATDTHFFDNYPSVVKKMRSPDDVVKTTFKALKKGKTICTDGLLCKSHVFLHRFFPRSIAIKILGKSGEKTWNN